MMTQEYDTDPSTPGAKRSSDPRTGEARDSGDIDPSSGPRSARAVSVSSRMRPTTDPGIAPPAEPLPIRDEPMGIVVPPAARISNDTVDALLEGIRREGLDRGGTPQTAGETAAAYHSEHAIRAPQVTTHDEPKVVVERPVLAQTVRVRLSGSKVSLLGPDARSTDSTSVGSRSVAGRMAIAVVAGIVVVMLIFVALQRISTQIGATQSGGRSAAVAHQAATQPTQGLASAVPTTESSQPAKPTETSASAKATAENQPPVATVAASSGATRKPAAAAKPSKPKAKAAPSSTRASNEDLGEFKSAF